MSDKVVAFGPTAKSGERRNRLTELETRVGELEAELSYLRSWTSKDQIYTFAYALGAFEFYKIWRAGQIANGRKSLPISYWDLPFDEQLVFIIGVQKAIEAYVGQTRLGVEMGLHRE